MSFSTENDKPFHQCEFKDHLNLLRRIEYFRSMPIDALKVITYLCSTHLFRMEESIFRQGEDDGQAVYLLSGRAKLTRRAGDKEILVRHYEADAFIGISALLGPARRLYTLTAETDARCLVLTREKFARALEQFPQILPTIVVLVVKQVHAWEEQFLLRNEQTDETCIQVAGVTLV